MLKELQPFAGNDRPRWVVDGPSIGLSADLAVPLGMALHELATNAVRFGALSVPRGRVEVKWTLSDVEGVRKVQLRSEERGGPTLKAPEREGFGSAVLRKVLPLETDAEFEVSFDKTGLNCRIQVPLVEKRFVPEY